MVGRPIYSPTKLEHVYYIKEENVATIAGFLVALEPEPLFWWFAGDASECLLLPRRATSRLPEFGFAYQQTPHERWEAFASVTDLEALLIRWASASGDSRTAPALRSGSRRAVRIAVE